MGGEVFYNEDRPAPMTDEIKQSVTAVRELACAFDRERWEQLAQVSEHRHLTINEMMEAIAIMERGKVRR